MSDDDANNSAAAGVGVALTIFFVILALYFVMLFFLSSWIAHRMDMPTAAVVLIGIFLGPVWLVLLIIAAFTPARDKVNAVTPIMVTSAMPGQPMMITANSGTPPMVVQQPQMVAAQQTSQPQSGAYYSSGGSTEY